jgi:RNA polymerase sigma factor (sigma-70 family)
MPILPIEPELNSGMPSRRSRAQSGGVQARESVPESVHGRPDSLENLTARRCLKRIRRWRVPPRWSEREWLEEVEAETAVATLQALNDFDPGRGVPWGAFLSLRIMRAALARYRREWSYAIRRVSAGALDEYEAVDSGDFPLQEIIAKLLAEALGQLPHPDIWLIEGLFWEGKTEAKIAEYLGISQQAVSKRKRTILRTLRRRIEILDKSTDSGLPDTDSGL